MNKTDDLFEIGRITKIHGLKGRLKMALLPGGSYCPEPGGEIALDRGAVLRFFLVKEAEIRKGGVILGLEGIDTVEEARGMVGARVRTAWEGQPLAEDEYYWRDIIGSEVETQDGRRLGRVERIFPTGSNDVYVCRDEEKEILLPGISEVIKKIDVKNKQILVRLLPGLE